MSVSKDKKTGKWKADYYIRTPSGELKRTTKRGLPSKDSAIAWEQSHKHESTLDGSMSFGTMFEQMSMHSDANDASIEQKRNRLIKYAPDLWNKPLKKITKQDLLNWRSEFSESDLATSTKNFTISYLKQVFKYAETTYDIKDPSKILHNFKKDDDEIDDTEVMHIITPAEFNALISNEDSSIHADLLTFLYLTGCRKGEARGLLKKDYTVRNGQKVIYIHQAMRRGEKSLKTTKTTAVRYVPLDQKCIEICERLSARKGKYMFGDYKPIELTTLTNHFKADLEAAGLSSDIRIHDLRHSHVSLLWANNVPIPEISKRIGHSSPDVTMRVYSHIFDNKQSSSLSVLNSLKIK